MYGIQPTRGQHVYDTLPTRGQHVYDTLPTKEQHVYGTLPIRGRHIYGTLPTRGQCVAYCQDMHRVQHAVRDIYNLGRIIYVFGAVGSIPDIRQMSQCHKVLERNSET